MQIISHEHRACAIILGAIFTKRSALIFFQGKDEVNADAPLGTSDNPSNKIFTISNAITMLRLVLTFVFLFLFVTHGNRYVAIAVYGVAACTDWLDGLIARKTQTVSWFGKQLDPIVDRALLFFGVLGLTLRGELPVWIAVLLISRDVLLAIAMLVLKRVHDRPVDVLYTGKIATACLMLGFGLMLLGIPVVDGMGIVNVSWLPLLNHEPASLGLFFVYVGCIFSVITFVLYFRIGISLLREYYAKERANA
ncbi:MAG: CDP-alcohol phosphatidyltransferase family protein [Atopobiaceae bacterium]|nr:CDP-alcohol phosphatidyltransferase family protein [Atopobiaceae bacterium]